MNKPTLISALAVAALTASLALPGSASAASFMDQATQQLGGERQRDHAPRRDDGRRDKGHRDNGRRDVEHRRDDRRHPAQGYWAPSRYRHDNGQKYRYRHDYGHKYRYRYDHQHRPVVRHHYYNPFDDVRLRILYDLHL